MELAWSSPIWFFPESGWLIDSSDHKILGCWNPSSLADPGRDQEKLARGGANAEPRDRMAVCHAPRRWRRKLRWPERAQGNTLRDC